MYVAHELEVTCSRHVLSRGRVLCSPSVTVTCPPQPGRWPQQRNAKKEPFQLKANELIAGSDIEVLIGQCARVAWEAAMRRFPKRTGHRHVRAWCVRAEQSCEPHCNRS